MLSKKLTFSLTSLIVLLAFGLICAVPSAFADGDDNKVQYNIVPTISAGETMIDVSAKDGFQIATGRDRADRAYTEGDASTITFIVTFDKGTIHLATPAVAADNPDTADVDESETELESSEDAFGLDDIFIEAFDAENRSLGALKLSEVLVETVAAGTEVVTAHADSNNPGRAFLIRIGEEVLVNAYTEARGGNFEIYKLSFHMPRAVPRVNGNRHEVHPSYWGVKNLALDHVGRDFVNHEGKYHVDYNRQSNIFTIELVDDDEGDAQYLPLTGTYAEGSPGVVGITRILDRNAFQPIESGPFNVRIILTEEPKGGFSTDLIEVMNGSATSFTKGLSLKGPRAVPSARATELTPAMVSFYHTDGTAAPAMVAASVAADGTTGIIENFPEPTGRDNMFHQYVATITPTPGFDGEVEISIKQFADNVLPIPRMYVPLTQSQRNATILTGNPMNIRDARLMNEVLKVRVHALDDAKVAAATTAYEVRKKDNTGIFNLNPNLKEIGKGLVIPANGYLVLAAGKTDSAPISGVENVDAKIAKKLTAAQKLYNVVYDFKLPVPGNDLSNFFRNGGSLSLIHSDIPAATGSGHDDAKASKDGDTTHADYTGYVGATTQQYATGSVIINEVMWGLDGNSINSQYIELHNTTAADIGIDHLEWAISVGDGSALGGIALDTVSNNPASGYWQAPGSDGVSAITQAHPAVIDIVSMSRIMGATNGTMAASWAMSIRPSANIIGRRVGTPGAANKYAMAPAPPPAPEPEPPPATPVATASDLEITEIMVANSSGRLPQWIEIKNKSVGEVSLDGWRVSIANDPTDADVIASTLSIKLDGVTLDADQVALVVSKTGRNSGVAARSKGDDNTGDLDSNRIVNASVQIKPGSMTYSMLSKMSFRISLEPPLPLTSAVTDRGDVVGNLGGAWELPMSEAGRSSIIRREMGKTTEIMGTDAAAWSLASDTSLLGVYVETYYGDKDDVGTPGYDAGGALPVELSKFGAKRDRVTGQVIVTWETQSELNNAGFYIKRSQQKDSKFVAVNPTMIPGAGTTSEKQSYTYTDTTAQPNIVYYYQIEDVSLDGNRQTLTRAHRLKGHVGAAGKLTTIWGELKEQQ